MLTLHYAPRTCALASLIALEESGLAFEVKRVDMASSEQRSPQYLAINPKGRVPALGTERGILTETLGWESIFLVQAPLALLTIAALIGLEARPIRGPAGRPHVPANLALLLISGALTAALFLLVLLLVDGWRIDPAAAGVIVTVLPAAAIATGRLAHRPASPP